MLGDHLSANLGYLYENVVAQVIASFGKSLCYHTWTPSGKTRAYEVDFLLADKAKVAAIEVKSSNVNNHKSSEEFAATYSRTTSRRILFLQKDVSNEGMLELKPIYLAPAVIADL